MKHEIEFYDQHGLLLHSDPWYRPREIPAPDCASHQIVVESTQETLQEQGARYPLAKTVTVRTTDPAKLFPSTTDIFNPHFKVPS